MNVICLPDADLSTYEKIHQALFHVLHVGLGTSEECACISN